jgi:hypothetical protein
MFSNRGARKAEGTEEDGRVSDPAGRQDVIFAKEFGLPLTAALRDPAPSDGGAGLGAQQADPPPSKRHRTRYWTIASVGALVVLAAAGITAGPGQHPRSNVSAQGKHAPAPPDSVSRTSGGSPTGSTAPGTSLTAAVGSSGFSPGAGTNGRAGSDHAPGGHVSLIGAATFTGTPASPVASGNSPGGGGGTTRSPRPAGSSNAASPVTSIVGSTVSAVGSSVTTTTSQVESSVPGAASTTGVVNTVVDTLGQTTA